MANPLRTFADLVKLPISALSTLTAVAGYLSAARSLAPDLLATASGVLLLAWGSCALNQFQERGLDARMPRTRNRPLPSGRMRPSTVLGVAFLLALAGFWTLLLGNGLPPALIGLFTLIWYNGVYTYLKRVTAFAVVPGSLVGALPPLLGWTAGGGGLGDPRSLALAFFFFIWQVPHFWLLIELHGDEYRAAGLPTLSTVLSGASLARLTFIWTASTAASGLLLPAFGLTTSVVGRALLAVAALGLVAAAWPFPHGADARRARKAFRAINLYALAVILAVAGDPLLP